MRSPAEVDRAAIVSPPIPASKSAAVRHVEMDMDVLSRKSMTRFIFDLDRISFRIVATGAVNPFAEGAGIRGAWRTARRHKPYNRNSLEMTGAGSSKNEDLGKHFPCERRASGFIMRCKPEKKGQSVPAPRRRKNKNFWKNEKILCFFSLPFASKCFIVKSQNSALTKGETA
jgi:hypothetical protein